MKSSLERGSFTSSLNLHSLGSSTNISSTTGKCSFGRATLNPYCLHVLSLVKPYGHCCSRQVDNSFLCMPAELARNHGRPYKVPQPGTSHKAGVSPVPSSYGATPRIKGPFSRSIFTQLAHLMASLHSSYGNLPVTNLSLWK